MMNRNEIKEVAKVTNMTLEEAKKFKKLEKEEFNKAVEGMVKSNSVKEYDHFKEEVDRAVERTAICKEVIKMKKKENKELKKQIKADTKIQKKIEKEMKKIEKRNKKIAAMTSKMNINAVAC